MDKIKTVCCLIITAILLNACSFEKIGNKTGKGLSSSLSPAIDSIAKNLVTTIRTELTKDPSRLQLQHFIDSLLSPVLLGIRNTGGSVRDSFINAQTLVWVDSLLQTVTGEKLHKNLLVLQASVVGKTKNDVYEIERSLQLMIKQIMAETLSDSNRIKIGLFRDELLGSKTSNAINIIIDTAVKHIVDSTVLRLSQRMRTDIDPLFKDDVSFIRRNAVALLVSLGVLAAIIIALVWQNRLKYLRMTAMLTKQINDIPDQQVYDNLTSKIKNEAVTAGLEPQLRGVLQDNGLLNSQDWKKNLNGPS